MTKRYLSIVILLGVLCLEGCTPLGGFKPTPSEFENWTKRRTSVLEVKKALLECGVIVLSHYQPIIVEGKTIRQDQNSYLLGHRCMLSSGFEYIGEFGACKYKLDQSLSACQPDAIVPTRSVERRLNSYYCKDHGKNTLECQPAGQEATPHPTPLLPQNNGNNSSMCEYPDKTMQLPQDIQNQSNKDMTRMFEKLKSGS